MLLRSPSHNWDLYRGGICYGTFREVHHMLYCNQMESIVNQWFWTPHTEQPQSKYIQKLISSDKLIPNVYGQDFLQNGVVTAQVEKSFVQKRSETEHNNVRFNRVLLLNKVNIKKQWLSQQKWERIFCCLLSRRPVARDVAIFTINKEKQVNNKTTQY